MEKITFNLITGFLILSIQILPAQNDTVNTDKAFQFSGQLSGWGQYTPDISPELWFGGRYIPQIDIRKPFKNFRLLDFEASVNLYGDLGFLPSDTFHTEGDIKPYRLWGRYSTPQLEIRLGLQKINFGSAVMFRPLMWFDRVDPRDPLQLTNGVWGLLFRYYFLNNANLWLWGLYGNKDPKGWEIFPTEKNIPEAGGRIQLPISNGEAALSYHFRMADMQNLSTAMGYPYQSIAENRLGLDSKIDLSVGLWAEASWTNLNKDIGDFTNQEMITLGTDYTFGIGNGLVLTFEQLIYSYDRKAFNFDHTTTFSGLSLSYPIGIFDRLSAILYYDWTDKKSYNFINWQREMNHVTFYLMGYWNPKNYQLPAQSLENNRFAGKGLQVMVVWNH